MMLVLVDTCVWTPFFRKEGARDVPLVNELQRLIRSDRVQMIGPVRQELLSGARPPERFAQLQRYLRYYPNLRLDEQDDENAARYYNLCRQSGVQSTSIDLLICAVAVRHDFLIFTTDSDFDHLAKVIPIKRHFVRGRRP
jgi:predicted nucleic acid-binding protein